MTEYPIYESSSAPRFPRLKFEYGFDDREAAEAEARGFRSHVTVEFESGDCYPVSFYEPLALKQELENGLRWNIPCVAEPGMIVVPAITLSHMRAAIARLIQEDYFAHLRPIANQKSSEQGGQPERR